MWQHKGGRGIWARYVNDETGQDSYAEYTPKLVKQWCGETGCYLIHTENPRLVVCKYCGAERNFIIGFHELQDGKLIIRKK